MTAQALPLAGNDGATVGVVVEGAIAIVVLNHPKRRNALTKGMCLGLTEAMVRLDNDPQVKVIALRGANGDFSAGAALDQLDHVLFDKADEALGADRLSEADAAICSVRKPTVALVEGICMGGGWQIASACDVLLAADDVRLAITPSKLGILYPRAGLERLVRRVGADRAKYLLFSAEEIAPNKAAEWGLVSDLVAAGEFEEVAMSFLRTVSRRSQYSNVTMKQLIQADESQEDVEKRWDTEWLHFPDNEDLAAGRAAFMAKERPAFTWSPTTRGLS
ncbi:enoyl-CoA hydratase/isomerase family protein [Crystallibacter degradans]|uniref:enoyl-CoA hydratase/isomerase family protein n=1 Tax=Crystallibacter degradans TaxID=2726743 RepID=UPI0014752774|nr:enoyl-CoA hydratase/isomerase family protein [Arthrobacter sp. SF27]NMR29236.1 enoyl-CoA hydratase/isomerase family protein [Arthrobacter sp. SF27]